MNCGNCQELLSEFIDGELDKKVSADVETHLLMCSDCAGIYEDFAGIIGFCDETLEEALPPNPQALWCRINNVIEGEIRRELSEDAKIKAVENAGKNANRRRWSLSFPQVVTAVLAIAVISSLLTFVGVKNLTSDSGESVVKSEMMPSFFDSALSKIGLVKTPQERRDENIRKQLETIDYWNKRVAARKTQWNKNLRDAFDRNLYEIDQVVFEYNKNLQENPQDEVSGEMLDTALDEKVQLLREFSEL